MGAAHVDAGGGHPILQHRPLLGAHLPTRPFRHLDVEQVGGHDERLVVAVKVEFEEVLVVGRRVETAPQILQPLGQPLPLVVRLTRTELAQSLSP